MISESLCRAINFHQSGNLEQAKVIYQEILTLNPHHFDANQLIATVFAQQGNTIEAIRHFEIALEINPNSPIVFNNLGNVYKSLAQYELALTNYGAAINLKPDYAEAFHNKANTLRSLAKYSDAIQSYEKALTIKSDYIEAHHHLGMLLKDLGRFEQALTHFDRAIKINTNYVPSIFQKGTIYYLRHEYTAAIQFFNEAINKKSDFIEAYIELGNLYIDIKDIKLALEMYDRALSINPHFPFLLGHAQFYRMKICDWQSYAQIVKTMVLAINSGLPISTPFPTHSLIESPDIQKKAAEIYSRSFHCNPPQYKKITRSSKKIRLAYFSSDFGNHPVSHLLANLFEHHDRAFFDVIGFSLFKRQPDEWNRRIISAFDEYYEINGMGDQDVVKLVNNSNIDIVIDLNGYTRHSRPSLFKNRLAPIQIIYLGFLGTMGDDCYDYIIADQTLIPPNFQEFYTEKVLYLPNYQHNHFDLKIPDGCLTRKDEGLPEKSFVFASFNKPYKINPKIFSVWMKILNHLPNAVLWLYADSPLARDNLIKEANSHGVSEKQIIFAKQVTLEKHLARQNLADLALDTYPYNGGATTANALLVGLPVISLIGKTFAARYGASLLKSANCKELIVESISEYQELAIDLALNTSKLAGIKSRMKSNVLKSDLFNSEKFVTHFEDSLLKIVSQTDPHG